MLKYKSSIFLKIVLEFGSGKGAKARVGDWRRGKIRRKRRVNKVSVGWVGNAEGAKGWGVEGEKGRRI